MRNSKIYKYLAFTFIISSLFGIFTHSLLSNRHKTIVKTLALHNLKILNDDWKINERNEQFQMYSPEYLIDGIYKSMEGPKSSRYIQLNQSDETYWITGFSIKAVDATTEKRISDDFICHLNVDINDTNYYTNWGLEHRIGKQFPRLTTLSNGFYEFHFPENFGIPVKGNDFLFITTQALNHNERSILKKIKHLVTIDHQKSNGKQIPLLSKSVYIQLPYNKENPFQMPLDHGTNQCIPVETKNHSYIDKDGNSLSGHWIIHKGKKTYQSSINEQLQITDSLRLHFSAIHVHPFATSITLFDKTVAKPIFKSAIENYTDKIGLLKVEPFSSEEGIWLYTNHEYELILETNNTSTTDQDMMASMFLFFYDKELDEKLSN